jgi:hypothetical protein
MPWEVVADVVGEYLLDDTVVSAVADTVISDAADVALGDVAGAAIGDVAGAAIDDAAMTGLGEAASGIGEAVSGTGDAAMTGVGEAASAINPLTGEAFEAPVADQAAIDAASQATGSELSAQAGSDAINTAASNLPAGTNFAQATNSVYDAIDSITLGQAASAASIASIAAKLTGAETSGTGTGAASSGGVGQQLLGAGIGAGINALTGQSGSKTTAAAAAAADPFASQRAQYQTQLSNMMTPGSNFQATDPSYNWRFQQGENAVNAGAAASGLLNSGNRLTALQTQGQNMASTEFQNQYARLAQLSGANSGSTATAGQIVANSGTAAAAGTSALANNLANTGANYLNSLFNSSGTTQAPSAATDAASGYTPQTDSSQTADQAFGTMPGTAYDPNADYSNIV